MRRGAPASSVVLPSAPAQWRPDVVEVAQDLHVGVDGAALGIGQGVVGAEGAHDGLRATQVRSRHAREEVVLDLVVQSA